MYHHYHEAELIALTREVQNHPDLLVILAVQSYSDIYVHLAEIAAYLGIVLDGTYLQEDILKLCTLMTEKLIKKREIVIYTSGVPIQ